MILASGLAVIVVVVTTGGCVSTTTGPTKADFDNQDAAESNYNLGRQYYLRNNYERARDALVRALEFDPRMGAAHMTLGLTYEKLEIPRLAKEHYEAAVRYEPRNIDVRNTYAVFLCNSQRDFRAAKRQFDRIVAIEENDRPEMALTNAGVCMASQPDDEAAEAYFRKALDARREYPEALLQLTLLKYRSGDKLAARAFLQRYMAVQPISAAVLMLAIRIEQDMGNRNAEREYRRQLLDEFPDSPEARQLLGTAADAGTR